MTFTRVAAQRNPREDHASLHSRVLVELRQAIISGLIKPGERLVEERIADELGVSRNPVREAIRALASEGLIEVTAGRGASVATISEQEARETIELRALLEGHNARLAARRKEKSVIKRIEAILKKGTAAVAANRLEQLPGLNQEFHRELSNAGQNTVLGELLTKLRERTAMLFAPADPRRQARSWDEHTAILRAIIAGDEREAATLAADHVMRSGFDYLIGFDWDVATVKLDAEGTERRTSSPATSNSLKSGDRRAPPTKSLKPGPTRKIAR